MAELKAGVGRSIVTPRVGAQLIGYFNRPEGSTGVHDDLNARALVLDTGDTVVALCSVEILWIWASIIAQIRQAVAARCPLKPENVFIFCTHTHSAAGPHVPTDWEGRSLVDRIADAIVMAYEARQPARLGFGFGQLFGYNINRRWLNRPTDPSVGVMRVDTIDGKPLAVVGNYACHAVVMGYDNNLISADWPGYGCRQLEAEMNALGGDNPVALFSQGGAGDVNPLTETVRQRLAAGHPVESIGEINSFYGRMDAGLPDAWNIGDRGGGTFTECETIGRAYSAEVMRVYRRIETRPDVPLWIERVIVNGASGPDEPPPEGLPEAYYAILTEVSEGNIPMEIMLVGIGSAVLVSQPGEVFSETAVDLRKCGQQMGYAFPWLVSYANGAYAYLPPSNAFDEGGYEVSWARRYGLSRHLQERIMDAVLPVLQKYAPLR
jgi:hypothetical protein